MSSFRPEQRFVNCTPLYFLLQKLYVLIQEKSYSAIVLVSSVIHFFKVMDVEPIESRLNLASSQVSFEFGKANIKANLN
ncbi:hypothetical protein NC651_010727 [Populus alba x Populus x berolinensis]|nr:hypothetical protein NC651_010727 [Populus alba x Populus x berolinensis]